MVVFNLDIPNGGMGNSQRKIVTAIAEELPCVGDKVVYSSGATSNSITVTSSPCPARQTPKIIQANSYKLETVVL
jgi:hypothetical protein